MIGNIYITGEIGVEASLLDVMAQVKKLPESVQSLKVTINSVGGFVDVGFDIFNYLRSLGKPIETVGTGIVASIATVIFMAGSTRTVAPNTEFMIHLPWTEAMGNADELERYAKELRACEKQLLDFYKKELNLSEEALQPLLRDESWLTQDQLETLGFTTSQPIPVVAKAYYNSKTNKSMTEDDKGYFNGIFARLEKLLKPKPKNKVVQDATGAELDFTDLADDATIEVGATATIDGAPAEGEYTMPDGAVYVFSAGELTEIKEVEEDELAALKEENELLKQQITDAQASHQEQLDSIAVEMKSLKARTKSTHKVDDKKDGKKDLDGTDRTAGMKNYLTSKKGK